MRSRTAEVAGYAKQPPPTMGPARRMGTIGISELVTPERIHLDASAGSKRQLFQHLAKVAADATGLDAQEIGLALLGRERLGTTGIGDGIAIPHAKVKGLPHLIGFFVRMNEPVDYDSLDHQPVDLVFLLLAPEGEQGDQLKALARVARLLRDPDRRRELQQAGAVARVQELLGGRDVPPYA